MNSFQKVYCRTYQLCFKLAQPLLPYKEPKILNSKIQIVDLLAEEMINNVLIVTDKQLMKLGLLDS